MAKVIGLVHASNAEANQGYDISSPDIRPGLLKIL